MIFSPCQPLGYSLFLWASFYITLLNYNKTKCNKKPLSELFTGDKKKGLPRTAKLSNPNHETKQGYHGKYIYIGVMVYTVTVINKPYKQ